MNLLNTRSRPPLKAIVLLLASLIAAPCAANDDAQAAMDGVAYQLIQLLNQNEELTSEVAGLRGQIEELADSAQRARESQLKIATDLDARLREIETKPDFDNTEDKAKIGELESRLQQLEEALAAMHELVASAAEAPAAQSASEMVYESALEKYQAGNYSAAIVELQAFLQLYGDDPVSPGARYWLAEAQLREGEYYGAIETAETLVNDYPDSDKAPDTMFLLGKAHLEMGDATSARSAWEDLVAAHPDSDPAYKAQRLLEQLP
jgi:tol-pal system protein YbgF